MSVVLLDYHELVVYNEWYYFTIKQGANGC